MPETLPVVLIPGLNCSARLYAEQIPLLWRFGPVQVADHTRDDSMDALAQRFVPLPVAMDEHRKLQRRHLGESAGLGERDLRPAPRGLLRRFGPRRGVEERELLDALGRVPHDGQGDEAAHREPG